MEYKQTEIYKMCKSKDYNFVFNKTNGKFLRWGKSFEDIDDPIMAPNPEILDIEISTICHQGCRFCYKSNTSVGKNMTLEEFKEIFGKFDKDQLTQIAFGAGDIRDLSGNLVNSDLYSIMQHCRDNGVIPNITVSGFRLLEQDYIDLASICGAISTSYYDKDVCFNTIKQFTDNGLKQANIHALFSNETYDKCMELIDLVKTDERLKELNSVVFLWLKPTGDRNTFTPVKDKEKYLKFITKLINSEIRYGMDSCSAINLLNCLKENYPEYYDKVVTMVEACESSLFSYYIDVNSHGFPCSFAANYIEGIDLKKVSSFSEVWNNLITQNFRNKLIDNGRSCPLFDLKMVN